jgi:glycosyltransferase involved in cell wall biosynthesis
MSRKLHVSVVMPSYNQAKFIQEAIDSVLSQNYEPLDLLVMDGGSTDGTVNILKSYGPKIAFISQRDRGQSHAINQGLARVEGDVICWLNSDDMFTPNAIQTIVQVFTENPEIDFVYGKGWIIDETGRITEDAGVLPFDLWRLIHQRNFIQQPSCFFKKSLLAKVGPIDELLHYVMDWELWIRFSAYKEFYLDDYLSCNRTYNDNKTQSGQFRRWREIRTVVERYTDTKWPPVLSLYFLEATIQMLRLRAWLWQLVRLLSKVFMWGIMKEMSGRYTDGGIEPKFRFSIGNPLEKESLKLSFTPLSKYDPARLGQPSITIQWKSSNDHKGKFSLLENGQPQAFTIPLGRSSTWGFVHFHCQADYPGLPQGAGGGLPPRRIVGFLKEIEVQE